MKTILRLALAVSLAAVAVPAFAQVTINLTVSANVQRTCTMVFANGTAASTLAFGNYNPLAAGDLTAPTPQTFDLRCNRGTPFTLSVGNGGYYGLATGYAAERAMASTTLGTTQYLNANQIATADWPSVSSVRIWLLVRSSTPDSGLANTSSYTIGDQTITVNDNYPRQVFPLAVNLRN